MAPRTYKKKAPARKKTATRGRTVSIPRRRLTNWDGISCIANAYMEVSIAQSAGQQRLLSYTLAVDPKKLLIGRQNSNIGVTLGDNITSPTVLTENQNLAVQKYTVYAPLYNEYKVKSMSIQILTDNSASTVNPLYLSTDRGNSATVSSVQSMTSSAHKTYLPTNTYRRFKYGWTAKKGDIKDNQYLCTADNQDQDPCFTNTLKVFQAVPAGTGIMTHKVSILMNLVFHDTKHSN
jgi:hypothetical protein